MLSLITCSYRDKSDITKPQADSNIGYEEKVFVTSVITISVF